MLISTHTYILHRYLHIQVSTHWDIYTCKYLHKQIPTHTNIYICRYLHLSTWVSTDIYPDIYNPHNVYPSSPSRHGGGPLQCPRSPSSYRHHSSLSDSIKALPLLSTSAECATAIHKADWKLASCALLPAATIKVYSWNNNYTAPSSSHRSTTTTTTTTQLPRHYSLFYLVS